MYSTTSDKADAYRLKKNFKWYDGIIKEDHMDYDPNDIWNKKRNRQSPPNLDEWFKKFFKGKKSGGGSDISRHLGPILGLLVVVAVLLFLGSGFYTVRQGEKAVVLRFGERYGDLIEPALTGIYLGLMLLRRSIPWKPFATI